LELSTFGAFSCRRQLSKAAQKIGSGARKQPTSGTQTWPQERNFARREGIGQLPLGPIDTGSSAIPWWHPQMQKVGMVLAAFGCAMVVEFMD
jgi:hypothetical protein